MTTINAQINPSTKIVAKHITLHNATAADVGLANVDNTSDLNKPVSTAQQSALDLKADQATTYTKVEVDSNIANLVDTAPATLDTLNELAAALGDDANFAATTASALGQKLAKASNLSDLNNAATARTNLGLGSAATTDSTAYATAAQGARADLAEGFTSNVTVFGNSLVDDVNAAAARTTLELGNVTNESKATMFTNPSFTGNITGTLGTAAQPNITSVGTLTSLTLGGDIDLGTNSITNASSIVTTSLTSDSIEIDRIQSDGPLLVEPSTHSDITIQSGRDNSLIFAVGTNVIISANRGVSSGLNGYVQIGGDSDTGSVYLGTTKNDIEGGTTSSIPIYVGSALYASLNNRVGIGTSTPTEALDVTGNIKASGSITGATLAGSLQSNAEKSVHIGVSALANETTGSDCENIAIGFQALNATTTGTNNVAIGTDTLKTSSTNKNNIAIGKKALETPTADNNIALGFNSLNIANVRNDNVVLGHTNFQSTTAGNIEGNTVIGKGAGNSSNVGTGNFRDNVILGRAAFQGTTASSVTDSIFIGQRAGKSLKGIGSNDIGIGKNAFFGGNGGFNSGGNNIAIGQNANSNVTSSTSGSIKIGADAGSAGSFATNISTVDTTAASTDGTGTREVNQANGSHCGLIAGYANVVSADSAFIGGGHDNTIASTAMGAAILGGFDNEVTGVGSAGMALGSNLQVQGANQVVVGRFNTGNDNSKFIVGSGFSNANRINALEVKNTGQLKLGKYGSTNFTAGTSKNFNVLAVGSAKNVVEIPLTDHRLDSQVLEPEALSTSANASTQLGADLAKIVKISWSGTAGSATYTLPFASAVTNKTVRFVTTSSVAGSTIKINGNTQYAVSQDTIDGVNPGSAGAVSLIGSYKSVTLWSDGTEWFTIN